MALKFATGAGAGKPLQWRCPMLSDAPVGEEPVRGSDTAAWQPSATPEEGNLLPSPQPETASFPMRIQADHDAFVTLPESPAGNRRAFLLARCFGALGR